MFYSKRSPEGVSHDASAAALVSTAAEAVDSSRPSRESDRRQRQIRAAETRLLYENANTGSAVTIVIASLLAYALWDLVPRAIVSAWLLFAARFSTARLCSPTAINKPTRTTPRTADGTRRLLSASPWRPQAGAWARSCSSRQADQ